MEKLYCSKCKEFRNEGKDCPRCGDPLLDISKDYVVEFLAQEDNRRINRRSNIFLVISSVIIIILGVIIGDEIFGYKGTILGFLSGLFIAYAISSILTYKFLPADLHYFRVVKYAPDINKHINLPKKFKIGEPVTRVIKEVTTGVTGEMAKISKEENPNKDNFDNLDLKYMRFIFLITGVISLIAIFLPYVSLGNLIPFDIGATSIQLFNTAINLLKLNKEFGEKIDRDMILMFIVLSMPFFALGENVIHSISYVILNRCIRKLPIMEVLYILAHIFIILGVQKKIGISLEYIIKVFGPGFYICMSSLIIHIVLVLMYRNKAKLYKGQVLNYRSRICSNCGAVINDDANFCPRCGERVVKKTEGKYCTNCGAVLEDDSNFCAECGEKIAKEPVSNSCTNCGAVLENDSIFCPECGVKVNKKD